MMACPVCQSAEPALLGRLGAVRWYRCRQCGMNFSQRKP